MGRVCVTLIPFNFIYKVSFSIPSTIAPCPKTKKETLSRSRFMLGTFLLVLIEDVEEGAVGSKVKHGVSDVSLCFPLRQPGRFSPASYISPHPFQLFFSYYYLSMDRKCDTWR